MSPHTPRDRHPPALLDLIGDLYQAGLDPEHWPRVIGRLSQLFQADLACIFTPAPSRPELALYVSHHISAQAQHAYSAYYHRLDAWTQGALEQSLYFHGSIVFGERLIAPAQLKHTEFYQDFLKPNGWEWMITTALFDGQAGADHPATHLTFSRHADHAAFAAEHVQLLNNIAPHVRRALETHWRLTQARLLQTAQADALERLGYGLLLLDIQGRIQHLTPLAQAILQTGDCLDAHGERLHASDLHQDEALQHLLQRASQGLGGSLNLNSRHGAPLYSLTALPLREGAPLLPQLAIPNQPGVLLLLHDPARQAATHPIDAFARQHRISPAEQRVLQGLLQDQLPKEIAETQGVALRTVRTQLSSLYAKTGARNQRELIKAALLHE